VKQRHSAILLEAILGWTAAVLCSVLLAPSPSAGAVQLQGFYEAFARAQAFDQTWQFDQPNHYFELRTLATPWKDFEAFAKISANSGRYRLTKPPLALDAGNVDTHRPELLFNEGHILFRRPYMDVVAFSHQNRFWFSQPLLNIVDGNSLADFFDGPRSQALRLDLRNIKGFGGLFYYGAKSTNPESFAAGRFFKTFSRKRILFGGTFGRRDYGTTSQDYDLSGALDFELALGELFHFLSPLGRVTLVGEAGRNFSGETSLPSDATGLNGYQMELRDFRAGKFTFKLNGWYREPNFYTSVSNRQGENDRKGYFLETWWRVPHKQVDVRLAHWRNRAFERIEADGKKFDQRQYEVELYMVLKDGFSSWIKYRNFHGDEDVATGESTFQNLILELQGQNRLVSVRPEVRLRDFGTRFSVQGYGMEINLNVSSKWKFFGRFLNANENTESRQTVFLQARYSGFNNAELYLEYGDGGRSDRLAENDGFVSEGPSAQDQDFDRRVQLILRLWF